MNRIACHITTEPTFDFCFVQEGKFTFSQNVGGIHRVSFGQAEMASTTPPFTSFELCQENHEVTFYTDLLATQPLFYAIQNSSLFIDSDLASLVKRLSVKTINKQAIVSYFDWNALDNLIDENTFYNEVKRVLPTYRYTWHDGHFSTEQFWQPMPQKNATATHFKEQFIYFLRKSLGACPQVAANLSGGLDSSSVVASLAAIGKPTHSFYFDAQTAASSEEEYAHLVAHYCQTTHTAFSIKPDTLFEDYCAVIRKIAQPDPLLFPALIQNYFFENTLKSGAEVLVSGHGGDSVIGYGYDYLDELYAQKKWKALRKALRQRSSYSPDFLNRFFKEKAKPYWCKKRFLAIALLVIRLKPVLYNLLRTVVERKKTVVRMPEIKLKYATNANEHFVKKLSFEKPLNEFESNFSNLTIKGNEILTLLGNQKEIKVVFPFLNPELLEIAMSISPETRFAEGKLRGTIRQAFKDILPQKITERTTKASFDEFIYQIFQLLYSEFISRNYNLTPLWEIISKQSFEAVVEQITDENIGASQKTRLCWQALRVISLAIWIDEMQLMVLGR